MVSEGLIRALAVGLDWRPGAGSRGSGRPAGRARPEAGRADDGTPPTAVPAQLQHYFLLSRKYRTHDRDGKTSENAGTSVAIMDCRLPARL